MKTGFLNMLFPQIFYFADEGAAGSTAEPATAEPAQATETPKAPEWPGRQEILSKIQEAKSAGQPAQEGAEPPKQETTPAPEPLPAEKQYAKPETKLSELIEGFDNEEFKDKTVKDFSDMLKSMQETSKSLQSMQKFNDFLNEKKISGEDLQKFIEEKQKQALPEKKELNRDDFDTESEYQDAVKKAEAERINEERLRKLEEKAIAEENEKFRRTLNENIESAIKKHSDEALKICYLSNDEINTVLDILGAIPNDVDVDVIGIMNKAFDTIAGAKKSFAEGRVNDAVAKARPEHIKEYLNMKIEEQKKFLEANGQTPAPAFAQEEKPLTGEDFNTGRLKDRALQSIRELRAKK